MKVLIIASFAESILSFRGHLIKALQDKGCEVHVAAPGLILGSACRLELEERSCFVHELTMNRAGINPFVDLYTIIRMVVLMFRLRPEISFTYTIKPVIYGSLAAAIVRVPKRYAMITGLGYGFFGLNNHINPLKAIVKFMYSRAINLNTKVFFQNRDDADFFRENNIIEDGVARVVINGSGVDLCHYGFSPVSFFPLRFLMISRLLRSKGVVEYAEAALEVRRKHKDVEFYLVGWIDESPDAISPSELAAWVSDGRLQYLGRATDVRPALQMCSAFVLPSYREGTPRTALEAMAVGRAVITTDAPGCRETVRPFENGYLVPIKSVSALVHAFESFIINPKILTDMGICSRRFVEEKYDVRRVNDHILREMNFSDASLKSS